MVTEDCHSYQLTKETFDKFKKTRLLRCGKYFTERTMKNGKSGIRQKVNKSVLLQGLQSLCSFINDI